MSTPNYPHQSPQLTQFYDQMQEWVKDGTPTDNSYGFRRDLGLCSNLTHWKGAPSLEEACQLHRELAVSFTKCYNRHTPFNTSDNIYWDEKITDTLYTNRHRLRWIREHSSSATLPPPSTTPPGHVHTSN